VNIYGHMVDMDQNFKLFIISEYKNPKFGPDISIITTQVNFHVTIEGLEEQMLSIVISCQKSELEENSIKMRKEAL
jgi:dynein heavy chain